MCDTTDGHQIIGWSMEFPHSRIFDNKTGCQQVASYKGPFIVDSIFMNVHDRQITCFSGIRCMSDCLEESAEGVGLGVTANRVSSWRDKYVLKVGCGDSYTVLETYYNHWIIYFKSLDCIVCKLYLRRAF